MNALYLIAVFCSVFASIRGCNLPPQFWCDNVEIAKECQVLAQCEKFVWSNSTSSSTKVQLALYYESLCPDCKEFFHNQLTPTYKKVASIIDLQLVPYGNARETFVDGKWKFTCQHGEEECIGNMLETCALAVSKGDMSRAFPLLSCMEASQMMPRDSVKKCGAALGMDISSVVSCAGSDVGNKLEHQMAMLTDKLVPPHKFVPWITLNGVHTDSIQKQAESNLLKLVCDTYQGVKPSACSENTKLLQSPNIDVL